MKILVIDDEQNQCDIISEILTDAGYGVITANQGRKAVEYIKKNEVAVVLTDIKMPEMDGLEILKFTLHHSPFTQVVLMTAFGSIPSAVQAIKTGAYDYLTKPFKKDELLKVVHKAVEKYMLVTENVQLKARLEGRYLDKKIIGNSQAIQKIFLQIEKIKDIDATVLIQGESGTGKELIAQAIHNSGNRKNHPFMPINCGAIPLSLIESELFGHIKGAFTGALTKRKGIFQAADGGTVFLDEISTLPYEMQSKLLRVIQEKEVYPVGSTSPVPLNVRIIAATNENLRELIREKRFREDLYHRLNVIEIEIPPLRERKEDIAPLVDFFLKKFSLQYNKQIKGCTPAAIHKLEQYSFPGNVRELQNLIEKIVIFHPNKRIDANDIILPGIEEKQELTALPLPELEKNRIIEALETSRGNLKKAAQQLGITYKTLQYRIKKYQINRKKFQN
ncbi:MAG: sigma-54 dependent transcriptional regulator [Calditrichia bacterium]